MKKFQSRSLELYEGQSSSDLALEKSKRISELFSAIQRYVEENGFSVTVVLSEHVEGWDFVFKAVITDNP